ncbi:MAG: nucleotidyl transferase AbiEii/AbiGii toxin family protein [Bacteroidales bacterium]|nr:nucleotidyl transferase AbiEii/AbiGii toxin family protein [Bacteroidales bacterium]
MLYKETIEPKTLELLIDLQKEPLLSTFNLVGGTALALHLGHRKSIDLDFFTSESFDLEEVKMMLIKKYDFKVSYSRSQTLKGFINGVKVDFIKFDYPHLHNCDIIEEVRIESIPDIIAMKLLSITDNGSSIKDFIDIAYLSSWFSLEEMLQFFIRKITNSNIMMPIKALTYFDDIDFNESIVMLYNDFDWDKISNRLIDMTKEPNRIFEKI